MKAPCFLSEFWKIFRCHYRLWLHGVEHGDISLSNFLWDSKTKMVKLNDFDLARLRNNNVILGHTRTGTMPFMAFDLLCPEGLEGCIPRLYRHDAESFLWVLFWVLANYRDGKKVYRHFDSFNAPTYDQCYVNKLAFLTGVKAVKSDDPELWKSVLAVLLALKIDHDKLTTLFAFELPIPPWSDNPKDFVESLTGQFPQMKVELENLKLTLD